MRLRTFFGLVKETAERLSEEEPSDGVPEPIDPEAFVQTTPFKTRQFSKQAGAGPLSNGVPQARGGGDGPSPAGTPGRLPGQTVPMQTTRMRAGTPTQQLPADYKSPGIIDTGVTNPEDPEFQNAPAYDKMSPRQRQTSPTRQIGAKKSQNPMGSSASPQAAAWAVHPWNQDGPLPDLPQEGHSLGEMFGLQQEMPRPAGSVGAGMKAAFEWAKQQPGEFSARQLYQIAQQATGQTGLDPKTDQLKYISFQSNLKRFANPLGSRRATDEKPLIVSKEGQKGNRGMPTMYRWGLGKPAGAAPRPGAPALTSLARPPQPQQAAPEPEDFDIDTSDFGDEPTNPDASPFGANPNKSAEPDDDLPDLEDDEFAAPDEEEADEYERPAGYPQWLPYGTPEEFEGPGAAMRELTADGLGPRNPMWQAVASAQSSQEAMNIMRKGAGPSNWRKKVMVAKDIFKNLGKRWDE